METLMHFSKKFLNMDGFNSDASIYSSVEFDSEEDSYHTVILKIKDCSNAIHITLGLGEAGSGAFTNSLYKLDVLIQELQALKLAMIKAKPVYDERKERERLEREQRKKKENNEMDSNNSTPTPVRSNGPATTASAMGMENLQAGLNTIRNVE